MFHIPHAAHPARRYCLLFCAGIATNFIAACAHKTGATGQNSVSSKSAQGPWSGRISLKIQSEPPQAFFAGFELKGQVETGELTLINPLGSILGVIKWSLAGATFESAQAPKRFASVDELLAQTTGAAVPIAALFNWLAGVQTQLDGWTADLSQRAEGRIVANRQTPAPQVQLRLILDQ